jgi:hypothetical protein
MVITGLLGARKIGATVTLMIVASINNLMNIKGKANKASKTV